MASLQEFGDRKFPDAGLLVSSADRSWRGIAAELRAHPAGEIPAICPEQMEITLAVQGGGTVERRGNGQFQSTSARPGTLWLCPIGVQEDSIRITSPLPEIMHLYFEKSMFQRLSELASTSIDPSQVSYLADFGDDFIRQSAYRFYQELRHESAGGKLLMEHLAASMLLHIVGGHSSKNGLAGKQVGHLDPVQLKRVLDYIDSNIDRTLGLSDLAVVANLSPYQFGHAFSNAVGVDAHRYVSARRLELAKRLLRDTSVAVSDIGVACGFSTPSSFSRAFLQHVGVSPGRYRGHNQTIDERANLDFRQEATDNGDEFIEGWIPSRPFSVRPPAIVELTASIAHEVNQPLAAISTFGEAILHWLQRPDPNLAEATNLAHHVIADARRASEIVGRIRGLVLNRIHQVQPLDAHKALASAVQTVALESRSKSVFVHIDLPTALPAVMANEVQFQQVIVNLMMNAIQAMSP